MKIYTSYYANAKKLRKNNIAVIQVSRVCPRYVVPDGSLMCLAPTYYMIKGDCSRERYLWLYDNILKSQNAHAIVEELQRMSKGKDVALCCYEVPTDFCHRHLIAEWLQKQTGIEVTEWSETQPQRVAQETQLELF